MNLLLGLLVGAIFFGVLALVSATGPWYVLHPIIDMAILACLSATVVGLFARTKAAIFLVPLAFVAALAIFWTTSCRECGYDIGHWPTFAILSVVALPAALFAWLGTRLRASLA